ncbi:Uncharacterised protein [Chlamydia trachomatis]|nr:Uncharacterised protein [Chlamydia trachomatis]
MTISQTKLALGRAHSIRNVAVSFARLNLKIARQNSARKSYNNLFSSSHIWSATNNSTRNLIAIFIYLVVFISNINMAPINNLAILLWLWSSINNVTYNNRTCNLRIVNLFFFQANSHQIFSKLTISQTFWHFNMIFKPVNIYHWHELLSHHKLFCEALIAFN